MRGRQTYLDKAIHVPICEFCDLEKVCLLPFAVLLHLLDGHDELDRRDLGGLDVCLLEGGRVGVTVNVNGC